MKDYQYAIPGFLLAAAVGVGLIILSSWYAEYRIKRAVDVAFDKAYDKAIAKHIAARKAQPTVKAAEYHGRPLVPAGATMPLVEAVPIGGQRPGCCPDK